MLEDAQPLIIAGTASEQRLLASMNGLNSHLKMVRRQACRINALRLLEEVAGRDGTTVKVSEAYYTDHPDVQMLLERAKKYRRLAFQIEMEERAQLAAELSEDGKALSRKNVVSLLQLQEKQAQAIEIILGKIREHSDRHWQLVSKMLDNTRAKLMESKFHQDKMQLAVKKLNSKPMANGELERIASLE